MSGHSKWNNIKRKKEKADGAKAKIFTKIGRELAVAVKEGGSADPAANSRLRDAIAKAKAANVPNDNIDRIIKKAAGEGNNDNFENVTYEGYGPSGVAVIVEALTDNRNRTAADVRHAFDKFGGNLGTTGCVSFMFNKKGVIAIEREGLDEDTVMSDALEAGAADFAADEDVFEITTEPDDFSGVREDLEKKGYEFVSADVEMVPDTYTTITDEDTIVKMQKMLDLLEDNDDVQNVWHNWDAPEEDDEDYSGRRWACRRFRLAVAAGVRGGLFLGIYREDFGKEGTLCDTLSTRWISPGRRPTGCSPWRRRSLPARGTTPTCAMEKF